MCTVLVQQGPGSCQWLLPDGTFVPLQGSSEVPMSSLMKNYSTDSRHMVLLRGYQLQGETTLQQFFCYSMETQSKKKVLAKKIVP